MKAIRTILRWCMAAAVAILAPVRAGAQAPTPVTGDEFPPAVRFLPASMRLSAQSRIKDLVTVRGAREEFLFGTGLVIGLDGAGDNPKGPASQRMRVLLKNHDEITIDERDLNSKNLALVTITATLPPFLEMGQRFDIRVHAIGDAKSLKGGTLLLTPLRAPVPATVNPTVYAIAQGPIVLSGDDRVGNPTSGTIQGGASLEVPLEREFVEDGEWIRLNLNAPDFNTAQDIVSGILQRTSDFQKDWDDERGAQYGLARAASAGEIVLRIPPIFLTPAERRATNAVEFISRLLSFVVAVGETAPARVVVNDKTKTVTVTGNVVVRPCAVRTRNVSLVIDEPMNLHELVAFGGAAAPATPGPVAQDVHKYGTEALPPRLAPQGLLSPQDLVDIVLSLNRARMISAEVVVE